MALTVRQLRGFLEDFPDDLPVFVPAWSATANAKFTGDVAAFGEASLFNKRVVFLVSAKDYKPSLFLPTGKRFVFN